MRPRLRFAPALALASLLFAPACQGPLGPADAGADHAPAAAAAAAPADVVEPRPWAWESSDIPVDPRVTFGALDNGLRYAWMQNAEPEHRSYLRLHVDIGSTVEREHEQGMAHFLEHMAFNGSENFEAGELVGWFQERGMAFGAHANASTSFEETIYMINLPESDEGSLREGLTVLGDFAGKLDIAGEEVAAEIGVIDGEERERDSAMARLGLDAIKKMFAGTRLAERIPIGVKEVRAAFTDESVRAFYHRWYRPENMTLVLVGDFDDVDVEELIAESLGDLRGVGEGAQKPDMGTPSFEELSFALHSDEVPVANISASLVHEYEDKPVSVEQLRADVPLRLARRMLNTRFAERARESGAPFLSVGVGSNDAFELIGGQSLDITCQPETWKEALAEAEQGLRQALEYGFQQAELDEELADWRLGLDEAIEREATRSSAAYVNALLNAAGGDSVPRTAEANADIMRPALDAATVESCHAALREAWSRGHQSLVAMGGLDLGDDAAEQLREVYEASQAVPVEPRAAIEDAVFAYASSPEDAGEIVERRHVEDLDAHLVRFANGVRLNVKRTDFKERQIVVQARIGEGALALDPDLAAPLGMLAGLTGMMGGLGTMGVGAHDMDALRRLTAGRQAGVTIGAGEDRLSIGGGTTPDDLLLQLELMAAYISDPGWRDEVLVQGRDQIVPLVYQQMAFQLQGPIIMEFMPALHGGDPRFGLPEQDEVASAGMDGLRAWLAPQLAKGALEVTIVGDLDVDETIAAVAQTLGALPERRELRDFAEQRVVDVQDAVRQTHEVQTMVPGGIVQVFFPTTDGMDAATRRRLRMLSVVLGDRVRETVREELGESYSPSAGSDASQIYRDLGFLTISASADPERTEDVLEACLAVAERLREEGISSEELDRLREPELKGIRDAQRQNGFWVGGLGEAQLRPGALDEMRSIMADYQAITAAELTEMAREYLDPERASWCVVSSPTADS